MGLRDVLVRQKTEWEHTQRRPLVERKAFHGAQKLLRSGLIKVIVGPRRAGKSAFATMLLRGKRVAYVNFDETALEGVDFEALLAELYVVYPEFEHVFFDEVQNLPKWPLALNRLQREGKNVTVTGSNAHMLSGELMTHLTGRHIPIEILPFSFDEYLSAKGFSMEGVDALPEARAAVLRHTAAFLENGGYPETVVNEALDSRQYLSSVWNSIIYTDVVMRHSLRRPRAIADVGAHILANAGRPTSQRRLAEAVGIDSVVTLEKYLWWLEEAYLADRLTCYSHKASVRKRTPKKLYPLDTGFANAMASRVSPDSGRPLECAVMNELRKSGRVTERDLFFHRSADGSSEVDFAVRGDRLHVTDLIQVCWDMSDAETRRREVDGLRAAQREYAAHGPVTMTIVTRDLEERIAGEGGDIQVLPFWKWATSARRSQ